MKYRLLGPLEVQGGDGTLPLGGAKQRAVLALLLLSANRVVPRERLIDELWGDQPPETAVTTLQVYVSRLRKLLPERGPAEPAARLRALDRTGRVRSPALRVARRGGAEGGPRARLAALARGARALAGAGAGRVWRRAVWPAGSRAARGPAPCRAGGADRGRPCARPPRGPGRRAGDADPGAAAQGAPASAADRGAVPLEQASRGPGRLPGCPGSARRARNRAGREAERARAAGARAGQRARSRSATLGRERAGSTSRPARSGVAVSLRRPRERAGQASHVAGACGGRRGQPRAADRRARRGQDAAGARPSRTRLRAGARSCCTASRTRSSARPTSRCGNGSRFSFASAGPRRSRRLSAARAVNWRGSFQSWSSWASLPPRPATPRPTAISCRVRRRNC